ncbi:MAG: ribokinase [Rhodanobacteraceae bacterium]
MPGKVLVIGSYNQDHAWRVARFPVAGETVRGTGFSSGAGGKGFNQAVACVRQGVETTFVGARGDDALGTLAADTARAAGLDCHWQVVAGEPTGSAAILVDEMSQNQIVVTLGANLHLAPAHIHARTADFAACDVVLLQLETTVDAVQAALHAAASGNSLRILNPAPFDAGINLEMIAQCDLLTPNETEFALLCQHLTGTTIDAEAIAGMGDKELHLLCRRLPVACVIITLGSQGCFVSHDAGSSRLIDAQEHYRVPAEAVNAIDTTGAGDAFNGALAAALTRWPDAAAKKSVIHASRAAALSTEHDGAADSMVTFDAVTKRFGAPI